MNESITPPAPELLALLRCPLTHQPLRVMTREEAARAGLAEGIWLVREDGTAAYPLDEDGFPALRPTDAHTLP